MEMSVAEGGFVSSAMVGLKMGPDNGKQHVQSLVIKETVVDGLGLGLGNFPRYVNKQAYAKIAHGHRVSELTCSGADMVKS